MVKFLSLILLLNILCFVDFVNADNQITTNDLQEEQLSDKEQEQRAQKIFRQIRCLTCKGQVVESSNSDFASNIRAFVRKRIILGDNDEKIFHSLQEIFGQEVLQNRKIDRYNLIFWLLIAVFAFVSLLIIIAYYRNRSKIVPKILS